jgi:hypothetical protein
MRTLSLLIWICSVFVLLLVSSARCYGQQADTYSSITTDGTYIYTSVTVEGSMSCCWPPNTRHTYSAYNKIGSVGGWMSTTAGLGHASVVNNQEINASDGGDYTWDDEATVECTIAGLFFQFYDLHTYSIRLSAYIFNGLSNGRCTWVPSCAGKCSSQHTTNTFGGVCYTTGPYKQCFDLLQDGVCWDYRTFCYGKAVPGICSN